MLRRQPDGRCLYVIDNPLSVAARKGSHAILEPITQLISNISNMVVGFKSNGTFHEPFAIPTSQPEYPHTGPRRARLGSIPIDGSRGSGIPSDSPWKWLEWTPKLTQYKVSTWMYVSTGDEAVARLPIGSRDRAEGS